MSAMDIVSYPAPDLGPFYSNLHVDKRRVVAAKYPARGSV